MDQLPGTPTDGSPPLLTRRDELEVRFLTKDEYHLVDKFSDAHQVPRLDPNWSKVIATIDRTNGDVVGIMVLQLVAHAEPIILNEEVRRLGLWREMAEMMDGYLFASGVPGVYNQPTHVTAEALCAKMGFVQCEHKLWTKMYDANYKSLMPQEATSS